MAFSSLSKSTGDKDKLNEIGRQVAMHIAATSPLALKDEDVDPEAVERERAIFAEQAKESGKPEKVVKQMIEGRIKKFYQEVVLLKQAFVINPDLTVEKALKEAEAGVGAPIAVTAFVRYELGEGIKVDKGDFAAEVAAAAGTVDSERGRAQTCNRRSSRAFQVGDPHNAHNPSPCPSPRGRGDVLSTAATRTPSPMGTRAGREGSDAHSSCRPLCPMAMAHPWRKHAATALQASAD